MEVRSARLYEDLYNLCFLITKMHVWKVIRQRALYMRNSMEIHYPPFRYFGKLDEAHYDHKIRVRSILEVVCQVLQMAFCISSAGGVQNKEAWEQQDKNDNSP